MKTVWFLYVLLLNTVIIPILLPTFSPGQTPIFCFVFFWFIQTWANIFLSRDEFLEHLCYRSYAPSLDIQGQVLTTFGSKAAHENYRSCKYELHNRCLQKIQPGSLGLFFSIPTSEENRHLTATDLTYSLCIFLSFSATELLIFHTFLLFTAIHLQAKHRKTQENSLQTEARSATKDLITKLCF